VLREEETEKQGIASGIALGSPCFSGDYYLQGFSERTSKFAFIKKSFQGAKHGIKTRSLDPQNGC
jgi:hypothetical protein